MFVPEALVHLISTRSPVWNVATVAESVDGTLQVRVATVTVAEVAGIDEALRVAHGDSSGLAAAIVTEDEDAAQAFLDGYRGTAAFWQTTTRFTDGFALTGAPETGINVDWTPGPRGPVTYRDLWLRQYRVVGDGTQRR